jgi:uncharacterized protein YyaL (SSP411 family)
MTGPSGGFYSTQDADSEGEEGKFFVWTPEKILGVLGDKASPLPSTGDGRGEVDAFMAAYGVTQHGNASTGSAHGPEGKNMLEFVSDLDHRPAPAGSPPQPTCATVLACQAPVTAPEQLQAQIEPQES